MGPQKVTFVGSVPFQVCTPEDATRAVLAAAEAGDPVPYRLANAYCVALAAKRDSYRLLLRSGGVNFPDGAPVALLSRRGHGRQGGRIRGPSLFVDALRQSQDRDVRHYFLGGSEATLVAMVAVVEQRFPLARIAGAYSPPYGNPDTAALEEWSELIRQSGANLVWVGLGTPKQDYVAHEIAARTGRPTAGVGAAFDFLAGTVKEAPDWVSRAGFEWLYRLRAEPRRLWRRYLIGNLHFVVAVVRSLVSDRRETTLAHSSR